MATISVGGALGEGFSLIRRHPGAVALWTAVLIGVLILRLAVSAPIYVALFSQMTHSIAGGGSASPDIAAVTPLIQQAQALNLLLGLGSLAVNTVLICAVFRAVLHPEQSRFSYLRLGSAEVFLFIFMIAAFIAFAIAAVVAIIPVAIIIGVFAAGSPAAAIGLGVVAVLALGVGAVYLALRLSLIGPMMVDDGQLHLGDAWALTRGNVAALFGMGLVLVVIIIVAELVILGLGAALLGAATGGFSQLKSLIQQGPQAILAALGPALVFEFVAWIAFIGLVLPIFNAPWARAYRDLKPTDVAATFS